MEQLERLWETISNGAAGAGARLERFLTGLFGSSNARYLRRLDPKIDAINSLEPKYQAMSDAELRGQTTEFRRRLASGETLDDILVEAFAVCREGGRRFLGMRHYDVQLIGGMVLHSGAIAEMITGEGKTLVATLPAYLNALDGKGVHVVTVNDYLARRDMEWMGPLYIGLGLTVGTIQSGMESGDRQKSYACDITYGTNNEFGFDYLRDNMRMAARDDDRFPKHLQQSQGPLNFAIVDEVDNILIDEARTPLIISGPAHDDVSKYARADEIARQLRADEHFEVKEKEHTVALTEEGVRFAEKLAGVESFYTAGNMEWPHLIDNSLKAHHLYKRDVNYVVQNGEVVIVDEFTGRLMPGRQWSDGLHQAVEAREGVRIKEESQTLATVTLQNFFKLYRKVGGMTGTAMTEAPEFWKIYKLDVVAIPTNRGMQRREYADLIYRTEKEKYAAIADEIEHLIKYDAIEMSKGEVRQGTIVRETPDAIEFQARESREKESIPRSQITEIQGRGRPVLVGTVSIEKSERLSSLLDKRGIKHEVLNAKQHKREAEIVAQAGRRGAVTIATNMAGRGTDIILGGNPETMAWAQLQDQYASRLEVPPEVWRDLVEKVRVDEDMEAEGHAVRKLGGLHIVGTERHEARRIDLQLRGRSGRQGDPGSSRFYLSLEDDLMRIFAGEWVKSMLTRLGMQEGEAIESKMVSRRIEGAQKKREEQNFEIRKNLLEYDEVMDQQRKRVYQYRQDILDGANCKDLILQMIADQVDRHLAEFLDRDYGCASFAAWAGSRLGVEFDARDFRETDFQSAQEYARDQAERMAESQIRDAMDENIPAEEDPEEWSWEALAKWANTRWQLSLRDRDLKKLGREGAEELLLESAREAIHKVDLSEGAAPLQEDFGLRSALGWVSQKFALELPIEEFRGVELEVFKRRVRERASAAYEQREVEFPVMAGLVHFTTRDSGGQKRYDRDKLVVWARERFDVDLELEQLKNLQRDEIRDVLIEHSRSRQQQGQQLVGQLAELLSKFPEDPIARAAVPMAQYDSLSTWLRDNAKAEIPAAELAKLDHKNLTRRAWTAFNDHYAPELRRMERSLVLHLLDSAWKD
ncbi:MAG: preprotein translocase subunit SecA, partial [Planctomycetia bacterium]|nr:preprotein translocase subunit SecA [Planctomycetia bacterium]